MPSAKVRLNPKGVPVLRIDKVAALQARVPPQLLALGLLIEGQDANPDYVIGSLDDALRDADKVLRKAYSCGTHDELPQTPAHEIVHDRIAASDVYKKVEAAGGDPCGAVSEAIDQALLLGVALAYRYFQAGGAK